MVLIRQLTYGAVVTDDTVRNITVCTNAGVAANENVLLHLAAVAQTDSGASVDVVARIRTAPSLLVDEVGLRGERIDPSPHQVRRHRVIHEKVGYSDTVAILCDMHVYLVAQDLKQYKIYYGLWCANLHLWTRFHISIKITCCVVPLHWPISPWQSHSWFGSQNCQWRAQQPEKFWKKYYYYNSCQ